MEGQPYLNTIRLKGTLNLCPISILIDSGSTHNFIDPKIVIKTHCQPTEIPNTLVTIANGTKVESTAVCKELKWSMQGHDFCSDVKLGFNCLRHQSLLVETLNVSCQGAGSWWYYITLLTKDVCGESYMLRPALPVGSCCLLRYHI
ncbi:hypothetical protein RJ639_013192 [Escallonia herrerae]|uniref:Uncharacterized protein n=1 Tax=Escallonia herrerae TaxID=1293975 RepID=A0AA88VJX5_9ASTE|nr:hypothetical protein RJ639_013192 [Escallonia herrerae]